MNANDSTIPKDVSWVDYCDALGNEAWLESQKKGLLTRKLGSRTSLKDNSKSAPVPKVPSTLNGGSNL
jgi:hypothetical protein